MFSYTHVMSMGPSSFFVGGGFRRHVTGSRGASRWPLDFRCQRRAHAYLPAATHGPVEAERAGETGRRPHWRDAVSGHRPFLCSQNFTIFA